MPDIESGHDLRALRGELHLDEPMKKYTSWRAGGRAERLYLPADLDDLRRFLRELPGGDSLYVMGLGSNLLIRDGGWGGTVLVLHARLNNLFVEREKGEKRLIYAEAGVTCAKIARFAARHDLGGAEFLAGIPGTVGGALAMNAGCYGSETWEIVEQVQTFTRAGQVCSRFPADYQIGYRHVALKPGAASRPRSGSAADSAGVAVPEEWFAGAWFRLQPGSHAESRRKIKELLARRAASQPLNLPNAGSVFRNPPGDHAARLIESCGLKGFRIGGAMVSPKHANFIVNTGEATAEDIEAVIIAVRETVRKQTGMELIQEVRIAGAPFHASSSNITWHQENDV
ncbi:MAG: UDP-N-acetylmuramate dehydrogenase [Nitrosospira sp.]